MDVKWKSGIDPNILFEHINKQWNKDPDNQGFSSFFNVEYQSLLVLNLIDFPADIPDFSILGIIKTNIYKFQSLKKIDPLVLLREIQVATTNYLKQDSKKFVIFTSLSISPNIILRPFTFNDIKISFNDTKNSRFSHYAKEVINNAKIGFRCEFPQNYLPVRVTVNAKTPNEAFLLAENTLNIYRAFANFILKFTQVTISSGPTEPINKIVTGPIHTVHYPNAKIVDLQNWWFEADYAGPILHMVNDQNTFNNMDEFIRIASRKLKNHPYRDFMERILIRYVQALDSRDYLATSLKLWGIIESLTGTDDKKNDKLINRATYLFKDRKYYAWELNQLRLFRNSITHHGKSTPNEESYAYLFKKYADVLIRFHLLNNYHFSSIDEVFDLLDTPSNLQAITMKEKNLRISRRLFVFPTDGSK